MNDFNETYKLKTSNFSSTHTIENTKNINSIINQI